MAFGPNRPLDLRNRELHPADCKTLASTMLGAGKLAEMKILRDSLDVMLKIAEHNLAAASQKTA